PASPVSLAQAIVKRGSTPVAPPARPATRATPIATGIRKATPRRPAQGAGGSVQPVSDSADPVNPDEVPRQSVRARHRHVEEERAALGPRGLFGDEVRPHVLEDVDAVVGDEEVMDDEGFLRILARDDLHRPLIGADRDNLLGAEPLRRVLADAGLARVEGGVLGGELIEEVAPASVDDDDVAHTGW